MESLICECKNPIPQATLSHACQNCYKVLKEYARDYYVIIWHDTVTEVTVQSSPQEPVLNVCIKALSEIGVNASKSDIDSIVIDLDAEVQDIKRSVLLKIKQEWHLYYA